MRRKLLYSNWIPSIFSMFVLCYHILEFAFHKFYVVDEIFKWKNYNSFSFKFCLYSTTIPELIGFSQNVIAARTLWYPWSTTQLFLSASYFILYGNINLHRIRLFQLWSNNLDWCCSNNIWLLLLLLSNVQENYGYYNEYYRNVSMMPLNEWWVKYVFFLSKDEWNSIPIPKASWRLWVKWEKNVRN